MCKCENDEISRFLPQCPSHYIVLFPKFRGPRITRINTYLPGTHHMPGTVRGWLMGGRGLLVGTRSEARCKSQTGLDITWGWEGRRFIISCSWEVRGRFLQERLELGAQKGSSGLHRCRRRPRLCFFTALASLSARLSLDCSPGSSRLTSYSSSSG